MTVCDHSGPEEATVFSEIEAGKASSSRDDQTEGGTVKTQGFTFRGLGSAHGIRLNETSERKMALSRMNLADAMFHYTSADGLFGILSTGQLWSTALVATNDESEFKYGQGVLNSVLEECGVAGQAGAHVDRALEQIGIARAEAAASFEDHFAFLLDHFVSGYVTSFYRARNKQDYLDGLLRQWRGYAGTDGYAIEFSRTRLLDWIRKMGPSGLAYGLHDVFYERNNPTRPTLENLAEAVSAMFVKYVERWANHKEVPFFMEVGMSGRAAMYDVFMTMREAGEVGRAYFGYLASTKDPAFKEEAEVRVSAYIFGSRDERPVECFARNGMLVPYIASPESAARELLGAISSIIVGPGTGVCSRKRGLEHYLRAKGLGNVDVRRSEIPLSSR